ncbi:RNA-directed DNA polymerase [Aquimarina rhabdastrellae]
MKIELVDLKLAYRKLKSYYYYDNFSSFVRIKLAEFENKESIENKLTRLQEKLNSSTEGDISEFLNEMKVIEIPKSYGNKYTYSTNNQIISNRSANLPFKLEDTNFILDAPIEIHLISILWIIKEGYQLQESYDRYNYGYKLSLDDRGEVTKGLRLYDKYFNNYQKWRDNSIETAKSLLTKKQDVTIIQLDVKKYFHNVSLDFNNIKEKISTKNIFFTELLEKIHIKYFELLKLKTQDFSSKKEKLYPLPIGLLSSGILGNWHLDNFDKKVSKKLSPAFYGRYVDDIIIVLANTQIQRGHDENEDLNNFIKEYFIDKDLFKPIQKEGYLLKFCQNNDLETDNLYIQENKLSILEFNHKESFAALNNFVKKLKETSSIFWLLPEDEKDSQDFDKSANDLIYTDSINKLRSLNNILPSKFGASVFLAKRILSSLLADEEPNEKTDEQILTFFKGKLSLEFYQLWEKVSTYFVINYKKKEFFKFIDLCKKAIDESFIENRKEDVKEFLLNHLKYCISISVALIPSFLFEKDSYLEKKIKLIFEKNIIEYLINKTNLLRESNLIRHNYISFPLLNFTRYSSEFNSPFYKPLVFKNEIKLIEKELNLKNITIDKHKAEYSPRYINFFECNIHKFFSSLITKDEIEPNSSQHLLEESYKLYYKINYEHRTDLTNDFEEKHKSKLFEIVDNKGNERIIGVNLKSIPKNRFSIAVANHKIHNTEIENSIKNKLIFSNVKKNNLVRILNQTEEEKADILLLPEITVPFKWLIRISDESRRKQRAIIGGLEHFSINRYCYNYLITILPIEINNVKECIIIPRLKNYYSPEEDLLIKSIRHRVPSNNMNFYNLFKWKGLSFTVFNCYELASVQDRSLFVSKVDAIFASEFNKDWKYFSNIAESISRDVHCYYIQSNTSDIGDSRIIQPTNSNDKDILRLKGGNKSSVLTGTIDIDKLRNFQEKEYFKQKELKTFKPTPPLFNKENVNKR